MRTLLAFLCLVGATFAQEIQLTHQVIASSPVEAKAYSWTVLIDGVQKVQEGATEKTIIVTLHGGGNVVLILSVANDKGLQTFVSNALPSPSPSPIVDPTPPVPIPKPEGVESLVIVYESANQNPSLQKLFVTIRTTYKTYPVTIIDQDSNNLNLKAAINKAKTLGLPAIVSLDDEGDVVSTVSLPTTYEDFVEAVK